MPGKRVSAAITAVALLLLICRTESAASELEVRNLGLVTVTGSVSINQAPAISGQTLFTDSTIATAAAASLTLDVAGTARLEVSENTQLKVRLSSATLHASLKQGLLTCATLSGMAMDIEIAPEVSVVSDPTMPSQFTITAQEESFELSVTSGRVEIRDERDSRKGQQLTRVDPGMKYSTSAGLTQTSSIQNSLSEGKRAAIFAVAGGALALLFIAIVTGSDSTQDNFGGCVTVSGVSGC